MGFVNVVFFYENEKGIMLFFFKIRVFLVRKNRRIDEMVLFLIKLEDLSEKLVKESMK